VNWQLTTLMSNSSVQGGPCSFIGIASLQYFVHFLQLVLSLLSFLLRTSVLHTTLPFLTCFQYTHASRNSDTPTHTQTPCKCVDFNVSFFSHNFTKSFLFQFQLLHPVYHQLLDHVSAGLKKNNFSAPPAPSLRISSNSTPSHTLAHTHTL